jgi:phosphoribosylformylglycinamidine cyclo-ligase
MTTVTETAYARAGVDTEQADRATHALVEVLATIQLDRPTLASLAVGHYANVLRLTDGLALALSTDGVGTKAVVAEQLGDFTTIGIDCVAMNVNDVVCVGAEPIAMLDYISVEKANPSMLADIARGLKEGAERAEIEIPGGEVAQLPEMIRGHGSPHPEGVGFDLVGACFGLLAPDQVITGKYVEPGDVLIGLPSNGVHANGLTLARQALPDLNEQPTELAGSTVGAELLKPTEIYVRAALDLLASAVEVRGLAHITSMSFRNLLRLDADVGYEIDSPLPRSPIFDLVASRGVVPESELWEVFNMGCGFCFVVSRRDEEPALALLREHYADAAPIGQVIDEPGKVYIRPSGLVGTKHRVFKSL